MSNFPPLRIPVLRGMLELKEQVLNNPDFLDSPDIPYDGETLAMIKKIVAPQTVTVYVDKEVAPKGERGRPSKEVILSPENQQKVRDELDKLMQTLNQLDTDDKGLDTQERIQVTRLKANIIEQLLKQQERAFNVKRLSNFQEVVINILNDLVSEKDREIFLRRIEPYLS